MDSRIKLVLHPFVALSIVLYIAIQISRYFKIYIPNFLNSYLTDFICIPVILVGCIIFIRAIKKDQNYWPTIEATSTLTFFYCLLFELILPKFSLNFTSDFGDITAYFLGLLAYYIFIHKGDSSARSKINSK